MADVTCHLLSFHQVLLASGQVILIKKAQTQNIFYDRHIQKEIILF